MKTLCLSVIAILTISSAVAEDKIFPGLYKPDHLIPLDPNPGDWHVRYMKVLGPQLKLNAAFFARMILKPSFEGESCLRLHGNNDIDMSKSDKFFITCYEADKNIWYAMPENSSEKKQGVVTVGVSSAPVSKAFAKRLRAIWDQMLSRSRSPEKPDTTLDGITIEFATPDKAGEARNPMGHRSPRLFVDLGYSLIEYCKVEPANRESKMVSVLLYVTVLENYLKEHPVK